MKDKSWKKAGAVEASSKEIQGIIEGKKQERLQRQKSYREAILKRTSVEIKMNLFKKKIKFAEVRNMNEFDFMGTKWPLELAKAEFNLQLFYLKEGISHENYLMQALENDGYKEKDIRQIQAGRYIK